MVEDIKEDIFGNEIAFDGNPNLKKPNTKLAYTKEHIEEYLKCANDWKYFAENYYFILDIDKGMVHPKLRDYQIDMVESFIKRRFSITLASRQCVVGDSKIKIRNKKTGEIQELTLKELENIIS